MSDNPGGMAAGGRDGDRGQEAYVAEKDRRIRELEVALRHYADERNWINRVEFKAFPGFHGCAVARKALGGWAGWQEAAEQLGLYVLATAPEPKAAGSERAASSPVIPTESNNDEQDGPLFQAPGGSP